MRYLLLSIGTRGDMEPFLAVGSLLQQQGHEVHCAMPAQFEELVADAGFPFYPLDKRFVDLIEGEVGRAFMGQKGSIWHRLGLLAKLFRSSLGLQRNLMEEQRNYVRAVDPDILLYHPKCLFGRIWGMRYPKRALLISPIPNWLHPVEDYPHIAFKRNLGKRMNLFTYRFVNFFTAISTAKFGKRFAKDFAGLRLSRRTVAKHMKFAEQALYLVSPSLFTAPNSWPAQAKVMGYFERVKTRNWAPDASLSRFLDFYRTQPITFITFGSMINADPEGKTAAIIAVLEKHKIPAIINTSSGGLIKLEGAPHHIHFVDNIPYEWLFPQVHSVVHHGGSGTTHTSLKYGCASLLVPHIVDQFFWNQRVHDLGCGPLGVPIKKLNAASFEKLLLALRGNQSYKQAAYRLARAMNTETLTEQLLVHIGALERE